MSAIGTPQWSVSNRNWMKSDVRDTHGSAFIVTGNDSVSARVHRLASILKNSMRVSCLLTSILLLVSLGTAADESPFAGVESAVADLVAITGWKPLKKVEYDTMNRVALKRYLEQKVKDEVKPEEIRSEELALKKLGLVPQEFEFARTMVDLLTEQAAAFYDYRKKKLFLLEGGDPASQSMVVVHELAHALADQRFNLGKYIHKGKSDDSSLARMAVMEGQATWLMMESGSRKAGATLKDMPAALLDLAGSSSEALATQYPVLGRAPLYIRASLMFPYSEGLRFTHSVYKQEGQAGFSRVFREPPVSSQQILHPEAYFSNTRPLEVRLPELRDERNWTTVTAGSLGEFDHAVLLEQYSGKEQSKTIAPHWRGGAAAILEHKSNKRTVLLYASEWDSANSARLMFQEYGKVLRGKWKHIRIDSETEVSLSGSGDDGEFRVTLAGTRLSSVEGLPAGVTPKVD